MIYCCTVMENKDTSIGFAKEILHNISSNADAHLSPFECSNAGTGKKLPVELWAQALCSDSWGALQSGVRDSDWTNGV